MDIISFVALVVLVLFFPAVAGSVLGITAGIFSCFCAVLLVIAMVVTYFQDDGTRKNK
jgi:hypothetical protein